ncbi:MAG: class II aldolase/adducin family protein [Bacteroidota bacterium]
MEQIDESIHPAEQIAEVIHRIWKKGLTTASGGNITVRDKNGDIWATPASVDKRSLIVDDIVCINKASKTGRKPTSELPFHQAIYNKRSDINAVIHAHPSGLTTFSMLKCTPATDIIPDILRICGVPAVAPYQISGSHELAESVSEEFRKGHNCIIMENHATVVGGGTLQEALQRLETFELCAEIIIHGSELDNIRRLTTEQIDLQKIPDVPEPTSQREYSKNETELRESICHYTKRCYNHGLMVSSMGTFSSRFEKDRMLITPSHGDRSKIKPEDIIKVDDGKTESSRMPCSAIKFHRSIYSKHPDVCSIISSKPTCTMAFGVTGKRIDTRTTPESYVLAGEIPLIRFAAGEEKVKSVTDELSQNIHCLVVENDELIVTGQNLSQTYERLEVIEHTAQSLIYSMQMGNSFPIPDHELSKLKAKFLH